MRQIKFRAIERKSGDWTFGYYVGPSINDEHYISSGGAYGCREIIPETVGQYTGLKDRNGVEIYEGDILKHHEQNLINWVVCFENGCFGIKNGTHHNEVFYPVDSQYFFVDRVVIGNIHTKTEIK